MKQPVVDFRRANLNAGSSGSRSAAATTTTAAAAATQKKKGPEKGCAISSKRGGSAKKSSSTEIEKDAGGGSSASKSLKASFVVFFPRLVAALSAVPESVLGRALQLNLWSASALVLVQAAILPKYITVSMTYPLFAACRLILGTLYPAYASYKAVRTKNVREYVSTVCHITLIF
jgi:hypothetical protein